MKMRFAITLSLLVFAGCAYKKFQAFLDEPIAASQPKLPVTITKIFITDTRSGIDTRDVKISSLAVPGKNDQTIPGLSAEQKDVLEKQAAGYATAEGADFKAACSIMVVEGIKKYKSSWSGEDMVVKSKIRVVLADSVHTPFLSSAEGDAEYSFQSNIANRKNFEKLYQKAMKTALLKAMESISIALKTIDPRK
jgi:hypothetical protein